MRAYTQLRTFTNTHIHTHTHNSHLTKKEYARKSLQRNPSVDNWFPIPLISILGTTVGTNNRIKIVSGIMGAKQTSSLVPLCHPLPLSQIDVRITLNHTTKAVDIAATVSTVGFGSFYFYLNGRGS